MTKGYCPKCKKNMDECDWIQFKMCEPCFSETLINIKYKHLRVRKGSTDFFYTCFSAEWNYYLGRYYPKATLVMTMEHLNREVNIKIQ